MKMDSVYSFKSTFATCWDKLCLFFKRISVSKQPKRIQDCEGVVWDVSINPFSCTRATGETAEAEAAEAKAETADEKKARKKIMRV